MPDKLKPPTQVQALLALANLPKHAGEVEEWTRLYHEGKFDEDELLEKVTELRSHRARTSWLPPS